MSNQNSQQAINYDFAQGYNDKAPSATMVLHKDFVLHDVFELDYPNQKRHFSGVFLTNHPESFFNYITKRREGTAAALQDQTFVNAEDPTSSLSAKTYLNFGTTDRPEACNDIAVLELKHDAALYQLKKQTERYAGVNDFAAVLEEFLGSANLTGLKTNENGQDVEIPLKAAIKAFRNLKIDRVVESENKQDGYNQSLSDMEAVSVANVSANLPDFMVLESPVYMNLPMQKLIFAVDKKYENREKGTDLYLRLRLIGSYGHYLNAAENFQALLMTKLPNALIGNF